LRIGTIRVLAGLAFGAMAFGVLSGSSKNGLLSPLPAAAQNLGQRVVEGTVIDADSSPVSGATVFLKNLKNKSIRSFTSDPTGRYRFTQVNMAEDHELWAEKGPHKSAVKTVSEWDARKDFESELKLK
jgi:hypothetical protein